MAYGEWIKGAWSLESFTGTDENGVVEHILGEDAVGFICYSQDGWVSVQIIKPNRPKYDIPDVEGGSDEQTLAAARGMFAYSGTYDLKEEEGAVYHNLQYALIPNWIGSTQKRVIKKVDENILELHAGPVRIGKEGKKQMTCLRWNRRK
jgi:hypothetical protein